VEKHVEKDVDSGLIRMHQGQKWDDGFPQAQYCVDYLKQQLGSTGDLVVKQQEYLRVYLEVRNFIIINSRINPDNFTLSIIFRGFKST